MPRWSEVAEYKDILEEQKTLAESPLKIFIASGPFTLSQNLEYEPLKDLLKEVSSTKPDILVLVHNFFANSEAWAILGLATGNSHVLRNRLRYLIFPKG